MHLLSDRLEAAKRLAEERDGVTYSWAELARRAGVSGASMVKWRQGTAMIKAVHARPLARFLGVDAVWLEVGEGPMKTTNSPDPVPDHLEIPLWEVARLNGHSLRRFPSMEAIASITVAIDTLAAATFSSIDNLAYMTSVGDSMAPTFVEGDALIVDTGCHLLGQDGIYAFTINEQLFVKRFQRGIDGSVTLISDNAAYAPHQYVPGGQVTLQIAGRVVAAIPRASVKIT